MQRSEILVPPREAGKAALFLLACLVVAYWNVLFTGGSLVYSDNLNPLDQRISAESHGPDFQPTRRWTTRNLLFYANFHDPGGAWWQWEPAAVFLRRGLARGEGPWWDPYVGAGAPAAANLMPTFFFPPYLAVVLLGDTPLLRTLYGLSLVFSAGFFTYLLLRKHRLSPVAALAGATAFLFSGAVTQNVGSFLGQTICCLPFALYLTRRFLDRPDRRRAAVLAVGYAAVSLSSFPPLLIPIFGLTALYAVLELGARWEAEAESDRRRRRRAAGLWSASVALSLALVAFYYLPFLAVERSAPQVAEAYAEAGAEVTAPVELFQLVSPVLAGGSKVYVDPAMPDPGLVHLPYLGVVAALAALLAGGPAPACTGARAGRGRRCLFAFALAAAVLMGLKLLGVPPVQWIARLPVLENVHFAHYLGMPLDFLLALLAGLGVERLAAGEVSRRRAWLALAAAATVLLTLRRVASAAGALEREDAERWLAEWWLAVALAAVAAVAALLAARRRRSLATATAALLLLVLVAGEGAHNAFYPRQSRWGVWRHPPPYVEVIREHAGTGRVFSAGTFPADAGSAFEVFQLDSLMTFNSPRLFRLYRRFVAPQATAFLREAVLLPPEGVLDRADIEILAVSGSAHRILRRALRRGYETLYSDGAIRVLRRPSSPRYYFTSEYVLTTEEEALREVGRRPADHRLSVETDPGVPAAPNRADDPAVRIASFHRSSYRLEVDAPRPGLVYCSESDLPGWRATVDGRPAPILAANYAFRAVAVPAGRSVVELSYHPPGLSSGLAVSTAALLLVALALWPRRGRAAPRAAAETAEAAAEQAPPLQP